MKKIILILSILLLSGCFENSGYITKSCTKKDTANSLSTTTVYTFKFKNDIIDDISILYDYSDESSITITSIKTSLETQNKYLNVDYKVLTDIKNQYKIEYNIDVNSEKEILDKFMVKKSRTELVKNLKEQGFSCE